MRDNSATELAGGKPVTTKSPKAASIKFIRQFARVYVTLGGCMTGAMILN